MTTPDSILDACLNDMVRNVCTRVDVCSAEPANYIEATSTHSLANVTVNSADFTLSAGNVDGRKVSLVAQSGVTVNTPGTATHLAFTDGSALRHIATCGSIVLTTPAALNLAEFDILEINTYGHYSVSPVEAYVAVTADAGIIQLVGSLPEGNNGIAANYTNDVGIAGDGDVIFVDTFETYTTASNLTTNWDGYYQSGNTLIDTSVYFAGAKAVRQRMPVAGGSVYNAIEKVISPDVDELFVRAYIRFQSGYSGINSSHNGIQISANYAGPGVIPDGTDFMLVSIENSLFQGESEPGYSHAYVYHPEQNDLYGEHWYPSGLTSNGAGPDGGFGANFVSRSNVVPDTGTWICREVYLKLNTPGQRDGRLAFWDDGVLMADWGNIRFRDNTSVKIDKVEFHNGGQSSSQINDYWRDNIVIASSYIGPLFPGIVPAEASITIGADAATITLEGVVTPAEAAIIIAADAGAVSTDAPLNTWGSTIQAASTSRADVLSAINAAASNDIVEIPAGASTWASSLPLSKNIWLKGAGDDAATGTRITYGGGNEIMDITAQASGYMKISGIRFIGASGDFNGSQLKIGGPSDGRNFRMTDCTFTGASNVYAIGLDSPMNGLIDNCTAIDSFFIKSWGAGDSAWVEEDPGLGGPEFFFVEDCAFPHSNNFYGSTSGSIIDNYNGAKTVLRYCTGNHCFYQTHDRARSTLPNARAWEVYGNTFTSGDEVFTGLEFNCGTGVCWGNTLTGTFTFAIGGMDYKTVDNRGQPVCGGSDPDDENTPGQAGWICLHQLGSKYVGLSSVPADWGSYADSDPAYFWNNTLNGSSTGYQVRQDSTPPHLVSGRDYINNGTTPKPGYTAYTYPHPLRSL